MEQQEQKTRKRSRFSDRPTVISYDEDGISTEMSIVSTASLAIGTNSCRSVEAYQKIAPISHGMYGMVYKAIEMKTGQIVALKQIRMDQNVARDGFPISALREITILSTYKHSNIINFREMVVGSTVDKFFIVMDFYDLDLKTYLNDLINPFPATQAKSLIRQMLHGLAFLHSNWICHRDMKPTNILLNTSQMKLVLCDMGLARIYSDNSGRRYTINVVTLWYRCPELLLLQSSSIYHQVDKAWYSCPAIDIWSAGCIMGEILTRNPMFDSRSEPPSDVDQLRSILDVSSSASVAPISLSSLVIEYTNKGLVVPLDFPPIDVNMSHCLRLRFFPVHNPLSLTMVTFLNADGLNLLSRMLALSPGDRISAEDAASHAWLAT